MELDGELKKVNPGKQMPMIVFSDNKKMMGNLTHLIRYLYRKFDDKESEQINKHLNWYEFKMRPVTRSLVKSDSDKGKEAF